MRKTATVLLALMAIMLVPVAAIADGGADDTHRLAPGCHDYGFWYSLPFSAESAAYYDVEFEIFDPSGTFVETVYSSGTVDPLSDTPIYGSGEVYLCSYELTGVYTAEAVYTLSDSEGNSIDQVSDSFNIPIHRSLTRTYLSLSDTTPRYNQVVSFKIRSNILSYYGNWIGNDYADVKLLSSCNGSRWYTVRNSRTFVNEYGVVTLRYRWNVRGSCKIKAMTITDNYYHRSYSTVKYARTVR